MSLDLASPAEKAVFYPGDVMGFEVRVTDPERLVRRVFVQFAAAKGPALNAEREATQRGASWTLPIPLPLSVPPGPYTLTVSAQGDGGVPLGATKRDIEVRAAKFGMRIVAPTPGAAFHRNEAFDVVVQVDDPRHKTRRVFVYFEETRAKVILNGDREALRRGSLWTQRIHVPATAVPGRYVVQVDVLGEGLEKLGSLKEDVTVGTAPVALAAVRVDPTGKIYPGDVVRCSVRIDDPRRVVREVVVSCSGPDGKDVARGAPASRSGAAWIREVRVDEDQAPGTYLVHFSALGQGGEVVGSAQASFTVLRR